MDTDAIPGGLLQLHDLLVEPTVDPTGCYVSSPAVIVAIGLFYGALLLQ